MEVAVGWETNSCKHTTVGNLLTWTTLLWHALSLSWPCPSLSRLAPHCSSQTLLSPPPPKAFLAPSLSCLALLLPAVDLGLTWLALFSLPAILCTVLRGLRPGRPRPHSPAYC